MNLLTGIRPCIIQSLTDELKNARNRMPETARLGGDWRLDMIARLKGWRALAIRCPENFTQKPAWWTCAGSSKYDLEIPSGVEVKPIEVEQRDEAAYCNQVESEPSTPYGLPWFSDIKRYLEDRSFPPDARPRDRRTIQRLAMQFVICGDRLYKRSTNNILLRYLDEREAKEMIIQVHEGVCGPHMNGHRLAKKTLRLGYDSCTMERDCIHFVQICHKCQVHANLIHAPRLRFITKPHHGPLQYIAYISLEG